MGLRRRRDPEWTYADTMSDRFEEHAALVALIRGLGKGTRWSSVTEQVLDAGSACQVWEELDSGRLLADPARNGSLSDARSDLEMWAANGWRFLGILDDDYPARPHVVKSIAEPMAPAVEYGTWDHDARRDGEAGPKERAESSNFTTVMLLGISQGHESGHCSASRSRRAAVRLSRCCPAWADRRPRASDKTGQVMPAARAANSSAASTWSSSDRAESNRRTPLVTMSMSASGIRARQAAYRTRSPSEKGCPGCCHGRGGRSSAPAAPRLARARSVASALR